jgi:LPXTG-site transpeptidase (sortase) family protein
VDPFDKEEYNDALAYGIAHAKGTALPGKKGNTFLFAHSGRNFYDGIHMNVQFYLLEKMGNGDLIYIKYYNNIFTYEVTDVKRVWPEEIEYLVEQDFEYSKLTLMSCWPAGINYQRQIVEARLLEVKPF